jgi:hypothetical protein
MFGPASIPPHEVEDPSEVGGGGGTGPPRGKYGKLVTFVKLGFDGFTSTLIDDDADESKEGAGYGWDTMQFVLNTSITMLLCLNTSLEARNLRAINFREG